MANLLYAGALPRLILRETEETKRFNRNRSYISYPATWATLTM
jgi:hypothetical protein